jgi:hypothetical protein
VWGKLGLGHLKLLWTGRSRMALVLPYKPRNTHLETVDTKESSVFRPREASEDHHPHACTDGLIFLTYTVFDEAVGEEVERLEVVPCRRCAASR